MVYYFSSNTVSPSAFIYVGKDKVESKNLDPEMADYPYCRLTVALRNSQNNLAFHSQARCLRYEN